MCGKTAEFEHTDASALLRALNSYGPEDWVRRWYGKVSGLTGAGGIVESLNYCGACATFVPEPI